MKRWLPLTIYGIEGLLVLAAVYFEPTLTVRGKLHGEAFFDGKSTSWWRRELEHWTFAGIITADLDTFDPAHLPVWKKPIYHRSPSAFETWQERWLPRHESSSLGSKPPKLLTGDAAADPVLRELLNDPTPRIGELAQAALGLHPDYPHKNPDFRPRRRTSSP
jgi:hypothetical protein